MKTKLFKKVISIVCATYILTSCGGGQNGGGQNGGGNNSQIKVYSRTYAINTTHSNGAKESYTLGFRAADAAVSSSFTMYLWNPKILSNQGTVTEASITVHIYPDGGSGETCSPIWQTNKIATCQFTTLNNAANLNLDMTNNSGGDVSYDYMFMPGTTPSDGSIALPYRLPDEVIQVGSDPFTAGIVGGTAGDSSYYVFRTGSTTTSLERQIAGYKNDSNVLSITLYSDSSFTVPVYSCASLTSQSCGTIYNLTANTNYYLKITNNGSGNGDWIVYQLDFIPGNSAYIDNGINVRFNDISGSYNGEAYSVYMFNSSGVAVAGLWADSGTMPSGGATVKLKNLDGSGCVTATNASRIDNGTYTFVSVAKVNPGTTKPTACAGSSGYIRNAATGYSTTRDMSTVDAYSPVDVYPYGITQLGINAVSGTVATSIYCNVYNYNYTGKDDKYRIGWASLVAVNGAVLDTWIGINVPYGGGYRIRCFADVNNNGVENSGDSVFESPFYSNYVTSLQIDATTGWVVLP